MSLHEKLDDVCAGGVTTLINAPFCWLLACVTVICVRRLEIVSTFFFQKLLSSIALKNIEFPNWFRTFFSRLLEIEWKDVDRLTYLFVENIVKKKHVI